MISDLLYRLRALFRRKAMESELDAELRAHLERQTEKYTQAGMTWEEAARRARLEFGGLDQVKEECRDARGVSFLETLLQDVRFGLRMLRKNPGFTTVAVLTLTLGIGANSAIFTLFDGLVLRNLPVPHPEQIVRFGAHTPGDDYALVSLPMFNEIARVQSVFSGMFAWLGGAPFNIETDGQASTADVWTVTGNFYSQLGATPAAGRLIEPGDVDLNSTSPAQVAVLGYGFWRRNYGGARDVVGKTLIIERLPFTIIGVTREGFNGMSADSEPEITVPLTALPLMAGDNDVQGHLQRRDVLLFDAAGRLKPGVTLGEARAQLDTLWPAIRQASTPVQQTAEARAIFASLQMKVASGATGDSFLRGQFAKPVYALLAISGVVLLLACVNLASLMLSRAAARSHEFGVRIALGASRFRLVRQMLIESVTLSATGALAALAFANWGSHALAAFLLEQLGYTHPAALDLSPDWRILGFTATVAVFTGLLFGLAPAWRATREAPQSALQQGSRMVGRATGRLGKGLIVAQVALSVVLLAGAGLFIRTLEKLRAVQPGFRIGGVLEIRLFPTPNGFQNLDQVSYFHELIDRVSHLPGVSSAGIDHDGVGEGFEWSHNVRVHGVATQQFSADCERTMPGFFRTAGISLLQGRMFTWRDDQHGPHVVIVSENFAQRVFPGGKAIGQHIDITTEPKWQDLEIVGIVANASLHDIRQPPQPTVYVPTLQYNFRADFDPLLVQTTASRAAVVGAIRQVVDSLGHQHVFGVRSLRETVDRSILSERAVAMLSAFFGVLALLLPGIGLFGLMAYNVTRRTRELGIRLALGAQRQGILGMILGETLALTLLGIVVGVPCALAATRLIAHMLFGVTPNDPLTMTAVAAALVAVGALAGYIPARRAAKVDPMEALRCE